MIVLMLFGAIAVYVLLAIVILRFAVSFAATEKWKKRTKIITLIAILYFPVLEPLGSFMIYQTYGLILARATVNKTAQDVSRIYSEDAGVRYMLPNVRDPRLKGGKQQIRRYSFFEFYHSKRNSYVEQDLIHEVPIADIDKPKSKYSITVQYSKLPPFCEKYTYVVVDTMGEILGEYVEVHWFGSHLNQWLASMTAGRGHSGIYYPDRPFHEYIQSVLVPSLQSE